MIIPRLATARLRAQLRTFPVVLVSGPRQCGKTTLARSLLKGWRYLDFERSRDRDIVAADLDAFLEDNVQAVFDEAQRMPELFPALRSAVDRRRGRPAQYLLTGSAKPSLKRMAGESLAGRLGAVELSPFLACELLGRSSLALDRWFWGGYPPLGRLRSAEQRRDWLDAYIDAYLNAELPALGLRLPAGRLKRFWTMLAHWHGGILNSSELANSLGVSHHTVADYLDILEDTFMIRRLPPWHANVRKRLVKSPKVYLRDSGLLHRLLGLSAPSELESHPKRGASWEGFVIEEIIAQARLLRPGASYCFWGTHAGGEVDLVLEEGSRRWPIEIKASRSPAASLRSLKTCMADLGASRGFVVYQGRESLRLGGGVEAVPFSALARRRAPWLG